MAFIWKGLSALLVVPLEGTWHLGMNINPCDGHDFGYGGPWASNVDVGSSEQSLSADFLDNSVWNMAAGYITIARHKNGECEMSKTWELTDKSKSMYQYFSDYPGRIYATGDGSVADQHIHSDIPDSFEGQTTDPIFGADGGLAFNWQYSNNGARIAVPGGHYIPYSLPGSGENTDDVHGLGNEYGANTAAGQGSDSWRHDAGRLSGECHGGSCLVVGTDHGSALQDGPCWGSYAIYVSESDTPFRCTADPTADPTTDPTMDPTADPTMEPTEFHCATHGCDELTVCDEVTGECIRDCDVLHIDEFLTDCSLEWDSRATTINTLSSDIATNTEGIASNDADIATNAANIAAVVGTASSNDADIATLETRMNSVESKLVDIQLALDKMGVFAAEAAVGNVEGLRATDSVQNVAWTLNGKDVIVAMMAAINIVLITAMAVMCCRKQGGIPKYEVVSICSD